MKKTIFPVLSVICLCNTACKKEDNRQYSTWYVNEDTFTTNDVKTDIGKVVANIQTNNISNGFWLWFNTGSLRGGFPTSGSFKLDCSQQNPQWVCMGIFFKDTGFLSNENNLKYIAASQKNGKAQYILDTTWFYNSYRPNDSIKVHGIFNQP